MSTIKCSKCNNTYNVEELENSNGSVICKCGNVIFENTKRDIKMAENKMPSGKILLENEDYGR